MRTFARRLPASLVPCLVALLLACGGTPAASDPSPVAPAAAPMLPPPAAVPAPSGVAASVPAPASGELLYVRDGYGSSRGRLLALDGQTGRIERALPLGVPNAERTVLYAAATVGERTTVRAIELKTGATLRSFDLPGQYALPATEAGDALGGLSGDGQTLVLAGEPSVDELAAFRRGAGLTSRFVVLDTAFQGPQRPFELPGYFTYDVLAPGGAVLYLIEHHVPGNLAQYRVRALDLASLKLREGIIAEKGANQTTMEGYQGQQVTGLDGTWVYTLYRNDHHGPFVHALETTNGVAVCIDLPQEGKEHDGPCRLWALVLSPDGRTLYAVNAALGHVAEIDTRGQKIRRAVTLPAVGAQPAAAWRTPLGGAALSPDGATLFALGETGVLAIDRRTFKLRAHLASDWIFAGIAPSADGARLYAVSAERGRIVALDPATGSPAAELAGGNQPWGVLWVETRR